MKHPELHRAFIEAVLILYCVLFNHILYGQVGYQTAIGSDALDKGQAIAVLPNGNLLIGGQSEGFNRSQSDMLLIEVDTNGRVQWSKTYGGPEREVITDLLITSNNHLLITAEKYRLIANEGEQLLLMNTDQNGNLLWKKVFNEGDSESEGYSICPDPNGGYLITGIRKGLQMVTNSFFPMKKESYSLYLLKVNEQGEKQWSKILKTNDNRATSALSITALPDGSYLLVGDIAENINSKANSRSGDQSQLDKRTMLLMKVNEVGELIWANELKGGDITMAYDAVTLPSGEIVIAGVASLPGTANVDVLLLGINTKGAVQWAKTYGGDNFDAVSKIIATQDGGLLVNGLTRSYGVGMNDAFLIKTDLNGEIQWSYTYGTPNRESTGQLIEVDNSYLFTGATINPQTDDLDVWLVKVDKNGDDQCNGKIAKFNTGKIVLQQKKLQGASMIEIAREKFNTNKAYKEFSAENILQHEREMQEINLCK